MAKEKQRILIIEDYAVLARMYQNKLRADGFEVEVALDGEEGERMIKELKPDLVLLDIMLPKKDGLEVLEEVKKAPETAHIPVILLTNLGGPSETIERGLQLGAVAYLVKAKYAPRQVINLIKETLSKEVKKPALPLTLAEEEAPPPPPKVEEKKEEKPEREKKALKEAAEEEVRKATTLLEVAQKQAQEAMEKLKELGKELEEK